MEGIRVLKRRISEPSHLPDSSRSPLPPSPPFPLNPSLLKETGKIKGLLIIFLLVKLHIKPFYLLTRRAAKKPSIFLAGKRFLNTHFQSKNDNSPAGPVPFDPTGILGVLPETSPRPPRSLHEIPCRCCRPEPLPLSHNGRFLNIED